jgi:hypothetical protein
LQENRTADLDAIARKIVDALASGCAASPAEARFLLREYVATGRDEIRDALGLALAHALAGAGGESRAESSAASNTARRAAWLIVLVEAAEIADDERVVEAAGALVGQLRGEWPIDLAREGVAAAAVAVDACLRASTVCDPAELVQPAIDELERIIASEYRPGRGLTGRSTSAREPNERASVDAPTHPREGGHASDHATVASALLTAFEITGRLPYSMLAEELMSSLRAEGASARQADFADACDTAIVFCRLAALHDNADYRAAAILAPGADYRADAARILQDRAPQALAAQAPDAALYGIALRERISLR